MFRPLGHRFWLAYLCGGVLGRALEIIEQLPEAKSNTPLPLREACGPRIALRHRLLPVAITGEDGAKHRPVMLHRAILGSLERFLGILIEHHAGAFPLWLAPVQVVAIPVTDAYNDYLFEVAARLRDALTPSTTRAPDDWLQVAVGSQVRLLHVDDAMDAAHTVKKAHAGHQKRAGARAKERPALAADKAAGRAAVDAEKAVSGEPSPKFH